MALNIFVGIAMLAFPLIAAGFIAIFLIGEKTFIRKTEEKLGFKIVKFEERDPGTGKVVRTWMPEGPARTEDNIQLVRAAFLEYGHKKVIIMMLWQVLVVVLGLLAVTQGWIPEVEVLTAPESM